jgi:hypothetical protein
MQVEFTKSRLVKNGHGDDVDDVDKEIETLSTQKDQLTSNIRLASIGIEEISTVVLI